MTDEAYERRERAMALEARALMLMCDECTSVHSDAPNDVTVPPTVHISEAARVIGRWVESELAAAEVRASTAEARLAAYDDCDRCTADLYDEYQALVHVAEIMGWLDGTSTSDVLVEHGLPEPCSPDPGPPDRSGGTDGQSTVRTTEA